MTVRPAQPLFHEREVRCGESIVLLCIPGREGVDYRVQARATDR